MKALMSFDGFVKSSATFIITDDRKVVPDSLDTIFYLLKDCGIENVSLVNEMTVTIIKNQSCLLSKTALTDSFLEKEPYNNSCIIELSSRYLTSTFRQVDSSRETCTASDFVDPMSESGKIKEYAKGPTMYMAIGDLVMTPMSSTSVLSLLDSMSIPLSDLEEKVVSIGVKEGVSTLEASLTSKSSLTSGLSHLLTKVKGEN
ncbi:tyrosine/DOPA decarboxylase [Spatholobus suberectus]|nr:tyrosine/DOPA decarboxylase [Spatholobus suberectus]